MRNTIVLGAALFGLSACGPGTDAVWLFTFGETEFVAGDTTCQENFNAADCPVDGEDPESDWTITSSYERSDGAFFGQILDGPGGEKVLVVNDEVYIGEKSGGKWRFEWEYFQNGSESEDHVDNYSYTRTEDSSTTVVMVLDVSGGEATGEMVTKEESTVTVTETDVWVSDEVGLFTGQIFDDSPVFLEGDQVNYSDQADCIADPCLIEATSTVEYEVPFNAIRTDAGRDGYEGVQYAGQEPGQD